MRHLLIALFFFSISIGLFAQSKNEIAINCGFAGNELVVDNNLIGGPSYEGEGSYLIGLRYARTVYRMIALETGIDYSVNKIKVKPATGIDASAKDTKIKMLSVPIYGNVSFLKYFFVNAGAIVDFELNRTTLQLTDEQSGVGLGIGIGTKYRISGFAISLNPFLEKHAVIPFNKEEHQQRVMEFGVRFRLGYEF